MPDLTLRDDRLSLGHTFQLVLERTVRLPLNDETHPLPPGLGAFPVRSISTNGQGKRSFRIPMHDREALWLLFRGEFWKPVIVKVGVGGVNALTGEPFDLELRAGRQDYMVVPDQPWLDGIKAGEGFIRQFVAVPMGSGETVERHVTGRERVGGMQIAVFQSKPGRFPDEPLARTMSDRAVFSVCESAPMGIGAGGRMVQKIYPDRFGIDTWDVTSVVEWGIDLVHAAEWEALTGEQPPPSPITPELYLRLGLPWFALVDHNKGDISVSPVLANVPHI
jgi:hypothetical protein